MDLLVRIQFMFALCVILLSGLSTPGNAADLLTPLAGGNRSPLIAIYGLPTRPDAAPTADGQWQITLDNSLASSYLNARNMQNELLLDGESWRSELRLDYGLNDNLSLAAIIPFIAHDGGFLDSFIEDWHRTFGLPQGGRDSAPRNRLLYRYRENGNDRVLLDRDARGLGDLQLLTRWSSAPTGTPGMHLLLKLPTGDPDRLLGSGAADLSLWLTRSCRFTSDVGHFGLSGHLGGSYLGRGDVLPSRQRHVIGFAGVNGGWQPYSWLAAQLCLDWHSAIYRGTGLRELDNPALVLTGGFSLRPASDWVVELALSEDLSVGASPDIAFRLNLSHSF